MDIKLVVKHQYHACLATARQIIEKCPDGMWADGPEGEVPYWRVVYHTLFYTHYYSQRNHEPVVRWAKHRDDGPHLKCDGAKPSSKGEMLEYLAFCKAHIDEWVDKLDLEAAQCGFPWYKMGTLEHQIVNLRHIQNHTAALNVRLRTRAGTEADWVGGD